MATEIILPALGETMDEGTIARWTVQSGGQVKKGQVIAEVESNKAVFELESPATGTLIIAKPAGVAIPILTLIATVFAPGESAPSSTGAAEAAKSPATPAAAPEAQPSAIVAAPQAVAQAAGRQFVSPRARRVAAEKQVDVSQVKGSGPEGRVEERDVLAFLEQQPRLTPLAKKVAAEAGIAPAELGEPHERVTRADVEQKVARPAPATAPASVVAAQPPTAAETVASMGVVRRVIAQRMSQSSQTAASVTLTTELDVTEFVRLREQMKPRVEQLTGESLSYNVLLAKLAAIALRELPYMNARLVNDEIHTLQSANVGIAMDTERGLIVPVLRSVESKGLVELTKEGATLAKKARAGTMAADDMTGGTFTITNLGVYGIDAFTPIINLPECAILGVGRIAQKPAVWQGEIAIRHMLMLSLTFDHRLVDGAPAARFLQRLSELIQNPYLALLA